MVSVFFGKEDDEPEKMIMATKSAVDNGELYKCLPCDWLYTVRRKEVRPDMESRQMPVVLQRATGTIPTHL